MNNKRDKRPSLLAPINTSICQLYIPNDDIIRNTVAAPECFQPETSVDIDRDYSMPSSPLSETSTIITKVDEDELEIKPWYSRFIAFVLRIVEIIIPRPNPGIWTLERSMNPWTMKFLDDKVERSYQWHVNKRYLRSNRRFMWFLVILSAALIVYHWLVEPPSRFLAYLPCLVLMILPMLVCVILTYVCLQDRYFVYKHLHTGLTVALFLTSFAWMFGQPLVLLISDDPLILDPMHTLLIFFIFNLAITNLFYSVISTSILIVIQCLTCCIGLSLNGYPFSRVFSYLINDFFSLVLAYIFAFLCGRVRELYMRQIYLVRHFQKEEASILNSSRLKLEILEEGMRAMKNQHPHVSPPASPVLRLGPTHSPILRQVVSEPALPKFPPPVFLANADVMYVPTLDVRNYANTETLSNLDTPLLRMMKSCNNLDNCLPQGNRNSAESFISDLTDADLQSGIDRVYLQNNATSEDSILTRQHTSQGLIMSPLSSSGHEIDTSAFFHVLSELPAWFLALPLVLKSRNTRKSLWKRLKQYIVYRVCMYSGEEKMEQGFQLFYNPISICRVKVLALSAIVGGVTITALNLVVQNYIMFEVIIRIAYMPLVALGLYFGVSTKKAANSPRLCQIVILIGVYLIFIGYLLLVFDSNYKLRNAYARIDPFNSLPSLNIPSNARESNGKDYEWLPKSPFDVNLTTSARHEFDWDRLADFVRSQANMNATLPLDPKDLVAYQKKIFNDYIEAEARYMQHLNAMVLFCCFAACSSGLRLVFYLFWKLCIVLTISVAAATATFVTGFDGQLVRTVTITISVVIAGIWIARPIESELRKWYHIRVNYQL